MTKDRDTSQYLAFMERFSSRFHWKIPCIHESTDIFEIEKYTKDMWRYRLKGSNDWIDCSTSNLLTALDQNDVNLSFFKQQLRESVFSTITNYYDVVQDACTVFGEETIYEKIEDELNRQEEQTDNIITFPFK